MGWAMSNFDLNATTRGRENLARLMAVVFSTRHVATHYKIDVAVTRDRPLGDVIDAKPRLSLFWSDTKDALPLPYPLDTADKATDFVWNWLQSAEYGQQPDHDGSNTADGFIFSNAHITGPYGRTFTAICSVSPEWSEHHK